MGCPQSKPKREDGNDVTGNARGDSVYPERQEAPKVSEEEILKKMTKGQPDVYIPEEGNAHASRPPENGNTGTSKTASVSSTGSDVKNDAENTSKEIAEQKDSVKRISKKKKDQHIPLNSVFIPDNSPAVDNNEDVGRETGVYVPPVEVGDVDIGQGIGEVSMDNQTIGENGVVRKPSVRETGDVNGEFPEGVNRRQLQDSVKLNTVDGFMQESSGNVTDSSSSVRYQNKEDIQYGLPEGVPKPAPPRSKKADIINPTTFIIADKVAEEAPAEAFTSMTTLSGYLSGQVKKSEIEGKTGTEGEEEGDLPPPRPTTQKKKDIVPDTSSFRKIDENAKNTPDTVVFSVEKLAAHLIRGATSDLEKIRAFYFWICSNISYVYTKDRSELERLRFDAVSTLRQKQGSFVNLFKALCKEVNIPAVTILGASKGLRHNPTKQFALAERNHSWNAVYISGEWRFIDCTWGSGYLDADGKFHRHFDEFWFLTDPDVFAYDHFPTNSIWQLLDTPIDIEEFNKKPSLTEKSRELGFQLISHREPIVRFEEEVTIKFGTENYPLSNILAELKTADEREVNMHRCMKRIDENTFEVRVVPSEVGEYSLQLFGKAKDYRHAKFMKLMEYTLLCEHVSENSVIFPEHMKAWGMEPNYSELGFSDSVQSLSVLDTDTNEMTIELEQTKVVNTTADMKAVAASSANMKEYLLMTAKDKKKAIHVRFPNSGYYRLDIFAEGKLEKFEYAGSLLLYCSVTDPPKPFPKFNSEAVSKHVAEVIEPMYRDLPSDSMVTFKVRSRVLRKAMMGIPVEEEYGSRMKGLGELQKSGDIFSIEIKTPKAGETVLLSGCSAPPNVFWSRLYEYVTV